MSLRGIYTPFFSDSLLQCIQCEQKGDHRNHVPVSSKSGGRGDNTRGGSTIRAGLRASTRTARRGEPGRSGRTGAPVVGEVAAEAEDTAVGDMGGLRTFSTNSGAGRRRVRCAVRSSGTSLGIFRTGMMIRSRTPLTRWQ